MSDPVQCFMLEIEEIHQWWVGLLTRDMNQICPSTGKPHRLDLEVPEGVSISDLISLGDGMALQLPDRLEPMVCACGLRFTRENSTSHSTESKHRFRNPKTGKVGSCYEVATPGAMWYCPWLVDRDLEKLKQLVAEGKNTYLSPMYVNQWMDKRDPLCVMCPDGSHWMPDARSTNGDGWTVIGEAPNITASPSILTPGYHSFLVNGVFGADPNCKPWTPRT